MLEQETQNQRPENDVPQPVSHQKYQPDAELFERYEIKSWSFSPRIYKIIAASAIFNVLALTIFTQANLLTRKGCDSPLVSKVCQVLDTVYVSSILLGTDAKFGVEDYEKTSIDDADITYINRSADEAPLDYPQGYFALANPEEALLREQQQQMMNGDLNGFVMPPTGSTPFPGIPSNPNPISGGSDLINTKPNLPPPVKDPVIGGGLPDSPLGGFTPSKTYTPPRFPRARTTRRPPKFPVSKSPDALPDLDGKTAENKTPDKKADKKKDEPEKTDDAQPDIASNPVTSEMINKKPLQDFAGDVLDKVSAKKVDLSKPFMIVMQGAITKDGKFDAKKSRYIRNEGDQEMIDVAKSAVEAIGDSGLLLFLRNLNVENINFTLVQDDKQIYAIITSDQPSESKAKSISSGLNNLLGIGKMTNKEADTIALINAAEVTTQGKNFVLNFKLEKNQAQEMIKRNLDKVQATRQQQQQSPPQSNSTANAASNQNSAK